MAEDEAQDPERYWVRRSLTEIGGKLDRIEGKLDKTASEASVDALGTRVASLEEWRERVGGSTEAQAKTADWRHRWLGLCVAIVSVALFAFEMAWTVAH